MLNEILPLIPKHTIYTEAFFGGGAVFFAKDKVEAETINDINNMVVNFYEVTQSNFDNLKAKIEATLFSRATYTVAWTIYRMPHLFNKLQQAWAFYVATNMGFSCKIGSWGYDKYSKRVRAFWNKKLILNEDIAKRIARVQIENNDACIVIQSRDAIDAFHYVDPPYVATDQGHYVGYYQHDYMQLLDTLSRVQGKFLLSSYPSEILKTYTDKHQWYTKIFTKKLTASKGINGKKRKTKVEVLTANYPI